MVATYRSLDTDPKERFVHHQAGDGGFGGSSYIDLLAFREKDANTAWTSASDGTLEERLYYCQNQHADVVALIKADGTQREMARYSAYGVPFGLPVGDCDSDGDCDLTDQNQVRDWAIATPAVYDVRGDLNLDGVVDLLNDRNTLRDEYKGVTLGRGILSAPLVSNQRGVAGYVSARPDPTLYLIRRRVLLSELGAWAGRDPSGYVDGDNLIEYVASNPLRSLDPIGLKACTSEGGCTTGSVPHFAAVPVVEEKKCGPDITDDISSRMWRLHLAIENSRKPYPGAKQALDGPRGEPGAAGFRAGLVVGPSATMAADFALAMRPHGPFDYKDTKPAGDCPTNCPRSLTFCGECVEFSAPGNIAYAFGASRLAGSLGHAVAGAGASAIGGQSRDDHASHSIGKSLGAKKPKSKADLKSAMCATVKSAIGQGNLSNMPDCKLCENSGKL